MIHGPGQIRNLALSRPIEDCIPLEFELSPELEASAPPESRGLSRDQVRLIVSHYKDDRVIHTRFRRIGDFLERGDILVINTSKTLKAALPARRADATPLELHLSTRLPSGLWVVELRRSGDSATQPFYEAAAGETLHLPHGATATLLAPYHADQRATLLRKDGSGHQEQRVRLWTAVLDLKAPLEAYLARHGFPIRYGYVTQSWPISYYRTVYATELGSAEMPSAGRAFTRELLARLQARGIEIVPLILHTGVASLEDHEPPYEEYYRIPLSTAQTVNRARVDGRRVVAVGTTAVRALETGADEKGTVHPGEGWTRLVITRQRGVQVVDGLLTGLHEPRASHLAMLQALAGSCHLNKVYQDALQKGYLWHEFGDLHLLLP